MAVFLYSLCWLSGASLNIILSILLRDWRVIVCCKLYIDMIHLVMEFMPVALMC